MKRETGWECKHLKYLDAIAHTKDHARAFDVLYTSNISEMHALKCVQEQFGLTNEQVIAAYKTWQNMPDKTGQDYQSCSLDDRQSKVSKTRP